MTSGSSTFPAWSRARDEFKGTGERVRRLSEHLARQLSANRFARRMAPGSIIFFSFVSISVLTYATRWGNLSAFPLFQYSYLVPIALAAFLYGGNIALLVSMAATSLFVPLLVQEVSAGARSDTALDLLMVLITYNLSSVLISRWFELNRQRNRMIRAVEGMEQIVKGSLDLDTLAAVILQQALLLCDAEGGEVFLRRGQAPMIVSAGTSLGRQEQESELHSIPGSLLDWLSERNEMTTLSNLQEDPRFDCSSLAPGRGVTLLALPLSEGQHPIGLLTLWRFRERRFSPGESALLGVFLKASQVFIENAALYSRLDQALSRQTEQMSLLIDASTAFSSARNLDELLGTFCELITKSAEATFCKVCLLEPDGRQLTLRASYAIREIPSASDLHTSLPIDLLPWHQRAIAKGEPIILIHGIPETKSAEPERSLIGGTVGSVLLMPLIVKERCIGVASLGEMRSWKRSSFSSERVRLCAALARLGALAIENLRTFESNVQQGERLALLFDNVADGIFVTNLLGQIESFNPAAERITGRAHTRVIGTKCSDAMQPKSENGNRPCQNDCPLRQIAEGTAEGEPIQVKEWITRGDGTPILVAHSVAPLKDSSGQTIGIVSLIRDVTREEELVRLKSEFISVVSHELRTPASTISASLDLLTSGNLDERAKDEMLQILNRQSNHLVRLVDQVLESSRLETGRIRLTLEPLALVPLVEQVVSRYRSRYRDYMFFVSVERNPFALGAFVSVEQVLENLIQNAINYSSESRVITISIEEKEEMLLIGVADEGIGIPAAHLTHIFEPFYRLEAAGRKITGFGLGLYIARMLVEAQGGKIWAESAPGHGAHFYFTLKKLGVHDEEQGPDY